MITWVILALIVLFVLSWLPPIVYYIRVALFINEWLKMRDYRVRHGTYDHEVDLELFRVAFINKFGIWF